MILWPCLPNIIGFKSSYGTEACCLWCHMAVLQSRFFLGVQITINMLYWGYHITRSSKNIDILFLLRPVPYLKILKVGMSRRSQTASQLQHSRPARLVPPGSARVCCLSGLSGKRQEHVARRRRGGRQPFDFSMAFCTILESLGGLSEASPDAYLKESMPSVRQILLDGSGTWCGAGVCTAEALVRRDFFFGICARPVTVRRRRSS